MSKKWRVKQFVNQGVCRRNRTPRAERAKCGQGLKCVHDPQSQDPITQEGSGSKSGICLEAPDKSQIPDFNKKELRSLAFSLPLTSVIQSSR